MHPLRTVSILSLLAAISCISEISSDEVASRAFPTPGGIWSDGDQGCPGFFIKTEQGSICTPACDDPKCSGAQLDICGHPSGAPPVCQPTGMCAFECDVDADCLDGQACALDLGICVWSVEPYPHPAPGLWGTCKIDGSDCDGVCKVTDFGRVCVPFCSKQKCTKSPINECSENAPTTCDAPGACELPCDEYGACWGIDGMQCDKVAGMCVYPW